MSVLIISGSPSAGSRTRLVLDQLAERLDSHGLASETLSVAALPAQRLLSADANDAEIDAAIGALLRADVLIVGTPIYKASFSGLLKAFLDLLSPAALKGKIVLPLATGGSNAHFLALDYSLRPVLQALGASVVLPSVFATEQQVERAPDGNSAVLDDELSGRLDQAIDQIVSLHAAIIKPASQVSAREILDQLAFAPG